LTIDQAIVREMQELFNKYNLEMTPSNVKQAAVIASAEAIHNIQGTAPGWWVEKDRHILVAMPGPPREMQLMWRQDILPRLRQISTGAIIFSKTFKAFSLSEAAMGEQVSPLLSSANPTLGIYAKADGIHLRLTAKAQTQKQAEEMIAQGEASIRSILGEYIWGTDNDTLEAVVGRLLIEKRLSLAIIEDYSGGWLTAGITDITGDTTFFKGGLVACSDEAKVSFGVSAETISQYGAVSPEVAQAMAEAVRAVLKADIGLSITGIEETEANPMGIVYIGIADGEGRRVISRTRGKRRVTTAALFELRKRLVAFD